MELTIEHLAAYLPYVLKCLDLKAEPDSNIFTLESVSIYRVVSDSEGNFDIGFEEIKPILRSLSDLTKEIEHNGEKFVPMIELLKIEMDLHFKNCSDFNIEYNVMFSWVKYNFNFEQLKNILNSTLTKNSNNE